VVGFSFGNGDGEDGWVVVVVTCLVDAVGEGCRCGFAQDADDIEARNDAGVFGGLSLLVVEVGGDGYHGVLDSVGGEYVDVLVTEIVGGLLLAQVAFGNVLHPAQYHGADFFGAELSCLSPDVNRNHWFVARSRRNPEWHVLYVCLNSFIREASTY
jgi:hypothetical protein